MGSGNLISRIETNTLGFLGFCEVFVFVFFFLDQYFEFLLFCSLPFPPMYALGGQG